MDPQGQEFRQRIAELADPCCIMSGASAEKSKRMGDYHLKFHLLTCVAVNAGSWLSRLKQLGNS